MLLCFCLGAAFALSSCGSENASTSSETLRVIDVALDTGFLGEPYSSDLRVVGGLTPYSFSISGGGLPPGITLEGGSLRGTPTKEGSYTFSVSVSDGNLSRTVQEYTLQVDPERPPATGLTLNVPDTEVQRSVILRAEVLEAQDLRALRTVITWDRELFSYVPESLQTTSERFTAFVQASEGRLQVDVAVLAGTVSDTQRLFEFTLRPLERTTLALDSRTEFAGDEGGFAFIASSEGIPSALSEGEPTTPDDPTQPDDATNPGDVNPDDTNPDATNPDATNPDNTDPDDESTPDDPTSPNDPSNPDDGGES